MSDGFPRYDPRRDGDGPGGFGRGPEPGGGDDDNDFEREVKETRDPVVHEAHIRRSLLSVMLAIGFAFLLASIMPQPLMAAAFSEVCFFGALGVGIVAAVRREPIWGAPVLTGWDRAALLLLASQVSGTFVDAVAVEEYLRQVQQTGQL